MCLFCTLDVLECHPFIAVHFFSASWMICRLYTQKILCIFAYFPLISNGGHFWPRTTQVWLFFLRPFSFFESSPQFFIFFYFLWSHSDCHTSHQMFKNYLFFCLKWPNNTRGLNECCHLALHQRTNKCSLGETSFRSILPTSKFRTVV